jgi:precorrin-8X/cobalt-precorrin-8 methylmutase
VDYLSDPAAIYEKSFAIIRDEADLSRFDPDEAEVAIRLIHACGRIEIAEDLVFSNEAISAGIEALSAGRGVLCDAEMVATGLVRQRLPRCNEVICTLNDPRTSILAREIGNTRSAAAVELWGDRLDGALVVIGNAPTALFHLLELLDLGAPKPALIIGLPVGFVGAAESKDELVANPRNVPFVTLTGRAGGSAMAAAAVNAIVGLAGRNH